MGIFFVGRTQLLDPRNTVSGENVNVMMDSYVNILKNGCGHGDVSYYTKVQ